MTERSAWVMGDNCRLYVKCGRCKKNRLPYGFERQVTDRSVVVGVCVYCRQKETAHAEGAE